MQEETTPEEKEREFTINVIATHDPSLSMKIHWREKDGERVSLKAKPPKTLFDIENLYCKVSYAKWIHAGKQLPSDTELASIPGLLEGANSNLYLFAGEKRIPVSNRMYEMVARPSTSQAIPATATQRASQQPSSSSIHPSLPSSSSISNVHRSSSTSSASISSNHIPSHQQEERISPSSSSSYTNIAPPIDTIVDVQDIVRRAYDRKGEAAAAGSIPVLPQDSVERIIPQSIGLPDFSLDPIVGPFYMTVNGINYQINTGPPVHSCFNASQLKAIRNTCKQTQPGTSENPRAIVGYIGVAGDENMEGLFNADGTVVRARALRRAGRAAAAAAGAAGGVPVVAPHPPRQNLRVFVANVNLNRIGDAFSAIFKLCIVIYFATSYLSKWKAVLISVGYSLVYLEQQFGLFRPIFQEIENIRRDRRAIAAARAIQQQQQQAQLQAGPINNNGQIAPGEVGNNDQAPVPEQVVAPVDESLLGLFAKAIITFFSSMIPNGGPVNRGGEQALIG